MVSGGAELANGEYVSGDFFRGLGVAPEAGRLILKDDERIGTEVVVISDGFSRKHFGDPLRAAGRKMLFNNLPFTIVGVTPPGFYGVDSGSAPDFYLPLHADLALGSTA